MAEARQLRIIPALAGNTVNIPPRGVKHRDHPRSRGEYTDAELVGEGVYGSSPLSRGILPCAAWATLADGIIPALAGNTVMVFPFVCPRPDHPRSRGEYHIEAHSEDDQYGSSPLSRGIRTQHPRGLRLRRIIPALAGNTPPGGLFTS